MIATTEFQLAKMFSIAGPMIGKHRLLEEKTPSGYSAWHVQWPYENGTITCKSVGGQAFTRYEWEFNAWTDGPGQGQWNRFN